MCVGYRSQLSFLSGVVGKALEDILVRAVREAQMLTAQAGRRERRGEAHSVRVEIEASQHPRPHLHLISLKTPALVAV